MSAPSEVLVRDSSAHDVGHVQAIYAHHVLHGLGTLEETPPAPAEIASRRASLHSRGFPHLVAETGGRVVGFCSAGPYRPRSGYRHTVEDSVYVAAGCERRGIGRALLAALIARCESGPWRQMVAVIGDSANAASIALHRSLGFELAGTLKGVGFKHGRSVDTVLMQRPLGAPLEPLFTIRQATPADEDGVLACLRAAFEPYREQYTPEGYQGTVLTPETFRARRSSMSVLVAVSRTGEVVGTLSSRVVEPEEGHLRGMGVRPAWQGMGVAERLLEETERELRDAGCVRISLDTVEPLHRAVRFYEKHGFRPSGRTGEFFGMGHVEHVKTLGSRVRER